MGPWILAKIRDLPMHLQMLFSVNPDTDGRKRITAGPPNILNMLFSIGILIYLLIDNFTDLQAAGGLERIIDEKAWTPFLINFGLAALFGLYAARDVILWVNRKQYYLLLDSAFLVERRRKKATVIPREKLEYAATSGPALFFYYRDETEQPAKLPYPMFSKLYGPAGDINALAEEINAFYGKKPPAPPDLPKIPVGRIR